MLIFQQGFIAKKLKGRSSRILREEFPHLKDWCGEQLWVPGCFMAAQGMVRMSWRKIFQLITHTGIIVNNPVYS